MSFPHPVWRFQASEAPYVFCHSLNTFYAGPPKDADPDPATWIARCMNDPLLAIRISVDFHFILTMDGYGSDDTVTVVAKSREQVASSVHTPATCSWVGNLYVDDCESDIDFAPCDPDDAYRIQCTGVPLDAVPGPHATVSALWPELYFGNVHPGTAVSHVVYTHLRLDSEDPVSYVGAANGSEVILARESTTGRWTMEVRPEGGEWSAVACAEEIGRFNPTAVRSWALSAKATAGVRTSEWHRPIAPVASHWRFVSARSFGKSPGYNWFLSIRKAVGYFDATAGHTAAAATIPASKQQLRTIRTIMLVASRLRRVPPDLWLDNIISFVGWHGLLPRIQLIIDD